MKKIALALGGGGARGLAHIQVIKALDRLGVKPDLITGTSIGALMGAAYASSMSGEAMEEYVVETFSNSANVLNKFWRTRPNSMKALVTTSLGSFGQFDIENILRSFMPRQMAGHFDELAIPLKLTATDFYGNQLIVHESGRLLPAIAASAAIPVLFKPVKIDGKILVDGGIANPLPFDLIDHEKYMVIAVDVVGLPIDRGEKMPSRFEAGLGASQLMMQAITNYKLQHHPPDLFLRAPVDEYGVMDFLKAKKILAATEAFGQEAEEKIEYLLKSQGGSLQSGSAA